MADMGAQRDAFTRQSLERRFGVSYESDPPVHVTTRIRQARPVEKYPPICVISAAQQGRLQEAQNWAI
jgi:hypothetical protein